MRSRDDLQSSTSFLGPVAALLTVVVGTYLLYIGKAVFLPLVIALIAWVILASAADMLQRGFKLCFQKALPQYLSIVLSAIFLGALIALVVNTLSAEISALIQILPKYQAKSLSAIYALLALFHLQGYSWWDEQFFTGQVIAIASDVAQWIAELTGHAFLIVLYVLFLFIEESTFDQKLVSMSQSEEKVAQLRALFHAIGSNIYRYIRMKTVTAVAVAAVGYLLFTMIDLDLTPLWVLTLFVCNYVPTFGPLVSLSCPTLLALVQFDTIAPALLVLAVVGTFQAVVANLLEPRWFGRSFNLSGIAILFFLTVWNFLWGVPGLFLAIPMMVITNICLAHFPATYPLAVLFSANGVLPARPAAFRK